MGECIGGGCLVDMCVYGEWVCVVGTCMWCVGGCGCCVCNNVNLSMEMCIYSTFCAKKVSLEVTPSNSVECRFPIKIRPVYICLCVCKCRELRYILNSAKSGSSTAY